MSNFPKNLSLLRRRAGYTQEGLAEALGVSRQAVSKWESGQTLPEAATLLILADLLGCTLDQLMRDRLEDVPDLPDPPETLDEADRAWAVFQAYDRHMDRYALFIALGTALIMAGVGSLLCLYGAGVDSGLMILPLLACIGVSVGLFIWGGLAHEDFQRQFPVVQDCYTQEDRERFRWVFRLGMALSVGSLMLDIGVFVALMSVFDGQETMEVWTVALLLLVLGGAIGAMVLLGILEEKYDLHKYAVSAAKLKPRS